jgi:hypothetical protein
VRAFAAGLAIVAMALAGCGGGGQRAALPPDTVAFDVAVPPPSPASRLSLPGSALGDLPAGTWAAGGFRNLGDRAKRFLEQSDSAGLALAKLQKRLERRAPIDVNRDLLSWLGDVSFFIEGTSPGGAQGAVVLGSTNTEASLNAIHKVAGSITLGGQSLHAVQRGNQVVLTLSDLAPTSDKKLADDPTFQRSKEALAGYSQVAYVSMAPALRFANSAGARRDPHYRRLAPYLRRFDFAAAGTRTARDHDVLRIVLGMHQK